MHNLDAISNSGEGKYLITQDVRRNTNGLSYRYDDADQLINSNPGLTQVPMP